MTRLLGYGTPTQTDEFLREVGMCHAPKLFERVLIPPSVQAELRRPGAPIPVKRLIDFLPSLLGIQQTRHGPNPAVERINEGERYAVQLAYEINPDLLFIDDSTGRNAAG